MAETLSVLPPVADGLALLIRLHEREPDAELLQGLRKTGAAEFLAGFMQSPAARRDAAALASALRALPDPVNAETLDALAAEYADVYLTHGYRIAPTGSVWLTEEKLERQQPMFAVREWYEHYGLSVPDWRIRPDDHIVHELQFVEFLLRQETETAARDAARFLDRHVLIWAPQFCTLMAERCAQPFMVSVARLTVHYLNALRDLLQELTGEARWLPGEDDKVIPYSLAELTDDLAYVPGVSESW